MEGKNDMGIRNIEGEEVVKKRRQFHVVILYLWFASFAAILLYASIALIPVAVLWQRYGYTTMPFVTLILFVVVSFIGSILLTLNVEKYRRHIRTLITTFHFIIGGLPAILLTLGLVLFVVRKVIIGLDKIFFNFYDDIYPSDVNSKMSTDHVVKLMESSRSIVTLNNLKRECRVRAGDKRLEVFRKLSEACDLKIRILKISNRYKNDEKVCLDDKVYVMLNQNYDRYMIEIQLIDSI